MKVLTSIFVCLLCVAAGLLGYLSFETVYPSHNVKEQTVTDDRGVEVKIPDYPTAVIPSDLRVSPIIETFARESTVRDKNNTVIISLPKDAEYIEHKTVGGYPLVVIDMYSPSKVLEAYTKLGYIFHREDIANSVTSDSKNAIDEAINLVSNQEKKKVLYLKSPYIVPKKGTIEDNILLESHAISIQDSDVITEKEDEDSDSYMKVTKEEIEAFAPDVIICKTDAVKRSIINDMPDLDAVKNEKVFSIEDTSYHFEFDEYHSIPAVIWVIKKAYDLNTPDPDKFFKWYVSATKRHYKF